MSIKVPLPTTNVSVYGEIERFVDKYFHWWKKSLDIY